MNKQEIAKNVFNSVGNIAKTSDFIAAGLSYNDVSVLCGQCFIERIRNGYYILAVNNRFKEEEIIEKLIPQGIVCVESALFHYGYNDFTPREWSIAVPRSFSRTIKKVTEIPIKAYYIQNDLYTIGMTKADFNGIVLNVYDRERTICDCFKYRTKLDSETFNKAINAYVADDKKNLSNLSKYAKKMHIYTKLMNVMEVLLNA